MNLKNQTMNSKRKLQLCVLMFISISAGCDNKSITTDLEKQQNLPKAVLSELSDGKGVNCEAQEIRLGLSCYSKEDIQDHLKAVLKDTEKNTRYSQIYQDNDAVVSYFIYSSGKPKVEIKTEKYLSDIADLTNLKFEKMPDSEYAKANLFWLYVHKPEDLRKWPKIYEHYITNPLLSGEESFLSNENKRLMGKNLANVYKNSYLTGRDKTDKNFIVWFYGYNLTYILPKKESYYASIYLNVMSLIIPFDRNWDHIKETITAEGYELPNNQMYEFDKALLQAYYSEELKSSLPKAEAIEFLSNRIYEILKNKQK